MDESFKTTQPQGFDQNSWSGDPFASDPFASPEIPGLGLPRPVVEIVQSLGGYRPPETPNRNQAPTSAPKAETPQKEKPKNWLTLSSPRFRVTPLGHVRLSLGSTPCTARVALDNPSTGKPSAAEMRSATQQPDPKADPETDPRDWSTHVPEDKSSRYLASAVELNEPPIDIRQFAIPASTTDQTITGPEPIRGAFQLDADFFEHHPTQRYITHLEELDREISELIAGRETSVLPDSDKPEDANSEKDFFQQASSESSEKTNQDLDEVGVVYAQDRQVIFVDGQEGYEYIDLSCIDIGQASFQANRIHVRNGVQEFEIDYRNVSHVLFANGQEVELANLDDDYF
jgi:hypothetical protein